MSIAKNIRTVTSGAPLRNHSSNAPFSDGIQPQYWGGATKDFYRGKLKYTTALFDGRIQGVDYSDFYAWSNVRLRSADVIDPTTGDNLSDDWQHIIIENTNIDTIPIGAYVYFNHNYWIVVNPNNVGSVVGGAIARRCNCFYCTYDYYGNVVQTPMVYAKNMALASANWTNEYLTLTNSYQHCFLQYNGDTKNVQNNTRFILGNDAYDMTGVTNFIREYTEEADSIHLIRFEARIAQASVNDDMKNSVADGKSFSWIINITGAAEMNAGATQTLVPVSLRNQAAPDEAYSYVWTTSDANVATVDSVGVVTAIAEGSVTITCALEQNPNTVTRFNIAVSEAISGGYVQFTTMPVSPLEQYEQTEAEAHHFLNGVQQPDTVQFSFSGARTSSYSAVISANKVTLSCYAPDSTPLTITATCNGQSESVSVILTGY